MLCECVLILRFVWKSLEFILEVEKCFLFRLKDGHICAQYLFLRSLTLKSRLAKLENRSI